MVVYVRLGVASFPRDTSDGPWDRRPDDVVAQLLTAWPGHGVDLVEWDAPGGSYFQPNNFFVRCMYIALNPLSIL